MLFGLTTTATIYLGWHYVVDDLAGLVLGALAILLARGLTGVDPRTARRAVRGTGCIDVTPEPRARPWRAMMAGPLVALVTIVIALLATDSVGLPLRDPDHVAALYLALVGFGVLMLVGLDIAVRAGRSPGRVLPSRAALRRVRRERWTWRRGLAVGSALVAFYLTYMAYRNLKSVVPLLRPGELFDRQLAELDRSLFGGNDPAALIHSLLGTGVQTHFLSAAYVSFILFLPLTIGLALVFSRDLYDGLFYTTAQSINWGLGIASYFLLPSLGPVYADPTAFANLPISEVTHLQDILLDQRLEFLRDPATGTPQSIAGFASLHISMSFTAALAAHVVGLARPWKIALWIWFAVTTDQHDLPGLALRARRSRGRGHGRRRAGAGRRAQRLRSRCGPQPETGGPCGRDERMGWTRDAHRAAPANVRVASGGGASGRLRAVRAQLSRRQELPPSRRGGPEGGTRKTSTMLRPARNASGGANAEKRSSPSHGKERETVATRPLTASARSCRPGPAPEIRPVSCAGSSPRRSTSASSDAASSDAEAPSGSAAPSPLTGRPSSSRCGPTA